MPSTRQRNVTKKQLQVSTTNEVSKSSQAKLPKLKITPFNGTYTDWYRFWGEYSECVDKTSLAPVLKFSYLREVLDDKVKKVIEALPITPEGYNRA